MYRTAKTVGTLLLTFTYMQYEMDGDGARSVEQHQGPAAVELPSVLAQLDSHEPATQRAAVQTIRESLNDRPDAYVPTVPKLRALLRCSSIDFHDEIAYCLAELAQESPDDVAPSTDVIVSFAVDHALDPATRDLLRCLAAVAADRPDAVVDHTAAIVDVLAERRGYDHWGLRTLDHLSTAYPEALEPAVPILTEALAANPDENGVPVLSALGRIARSDATLAADQFIEYAIELVDHETASLRNNAIGCLADVAHHSPSVVEDACPRLTSALESDDPKTRANAAVTIARVAAGATAVVEPVREQLLELLEDESASVRANACIALGYGNVSEARDRLAQLASEDPVPDVCNHAEWAYDRLS